MQTLKQRLDKLVDPQYGLIKYLIVLPKSADDSEIFVGMASIQDPLALPPQSTFTGFGDVNMKQGAGCGYTYEECLWSTVGESVERYAAAVYDYKDLIVDSYNGLGGSAINPLEFIRFSDKQYARDDFLPEKPELDKPIAWVCGRNITNSEEAFIPASMLYMYYTPVNEYDGKIDKGYSTGLAAGSDLSSAVHSGLREVVERDAYALHWLSGKTAPKIDLDEIYTVATPQLRRLLDHPTVNIELRDYTTDLGIPCILSHITSDCFEGLASGSSANLDPYACAEKAIMESFHTLNWCIDMRKAGKDDIELKDIEQYEHHVRYYMTQGSKVADNLAFLFADAPKSTLGFSAEDTLSAGDASRDTQTMVHMLEERGYQTYVADLTTDEIADAGFVVTKTLVPGLQPLYCGVGNEHLDTRRLMKFVTSMNHELPVPLNTKPHPFP